MKQPAARRQIKTLYLQKKKKKQFTDVEKVADTHGLLKTYSEV